MSQSPDPLEPTSHPPPAPQTPPLPLTARLTPLLRGWPLVTGLLLFFWVVPRGFDLEGRLLGHPLSDLTKHYWNLWWFQQAYTGPATGSVHTHWLNYPLGLGLYPIEPLNGILAAILTPLFGLVLSTNLIALLQLWAGALGGSLLGFHLTKARLPAVLAGLTYAAGSYGLWTVYVGVGELSTLGLPPLALLMVLKSLEAPSWPRLLLTSVCVFLTGYACWYYGLFLAILLGMLLLCQLPLLWHRPRALLGTLLAVGLGFVTLVPLMQGFHQSYGVSEHSQEPLRQFVAQRLQQPPHDPPFTRLDPTHLFWGGSRVLAEALHVPYSGGRYLGLSLMVLALLGVLGSPRKALPWLLSGGLSLLLGLGSRLVVGGIEQPNPLPFQTFNLVLERYAQPMNFPARFMMPLVLSFSVLMVLGLTGLQTSLERRFFAPPPVPGTDAEPVSRPDSDGLPGRPRWLLVVLIGLLGLLPLLELRLRGDLPIPLPGLNLPSWPGARFLRTEPQPGAVLELPQLFLQTNRQAYDSVLQMQVLHGRPSAHLPLDRIDQLVPLSSTQQRQNPLLASLALASGLFGPGTFECCPEGPLLLPASDPVLVDAKNALVDQGFAFIILTWKGYGDPQRNHSIRLAEQWLGPAVFEGPLQNVYRLLASPHAGQ